MPEESTPVTVYGHQFCGMVTPTLATLQQFGVEYEYVDIREQDDARDRVMQINNGNASVPTLVFPDGATLTEPSSTKLKAYLRENGYQPPPPFWSRWLKALRG